MFTPPATAAVARAKFLRSAKRGGRPRKEPIAAAEGDSPPSAFADKEILHRDPGTWIAPSRVSDFIDRVFG